MTARPGHARSTRRPVLGILRSAKATLPFFFLLLLAVVLITLFPQIVTALPSAMRG